MNKYIAKQAKKNIDFLKAHKNNPQSLKNNVLRCCKKMTRVVHNHGNHDLLHLINDPEAFDYTDILEDIEDDASEQTPTEALAESLDTYRYMYYRSLGKTKHISIKNQPLDVCADPKKTKQLINNKVIKKYGVGTNYEILHVDTTSTYGVGLADDEPENSDEADTEDINVTIILKK